MKKAEKISWKNIRITEGDHAFIKLMADRSTRNGAEQLAHIIKVYKTIFAEFGHDDVETLLKSLRKQSK